MEIAVKDTYSILVQDDTLIQNSSKLYSVKFAFDETWDGFSKTAIFEAGPASVIVALTDDQCTIPAECLKRGSIKLKIGIYGISGDKRKGTIWCSTSLIIPNVRLDVGTSSSSSSGSDEVYNEIMAAIGDLAAAGFEGKTLAEVFREIKDSTCETATDEEVEETLNSVFGQTSDLPDDSGGTESSANTATDEEVDEILDAVFGKTP